MTHILLAWTTQAASHAFFFLHEDIHATRVGALTAEELDTIAKNNLRDIALRVIPVWRMLSHNLDALLV